MLAGFYKIMAEQREAGEYKVQVELNREHVIYQAHFPGSPITPGVCILQISQELLEKYTGRRLRMVRAKNIKFLHVLSPEEHPCPVFSFVCVEAESGFRAMGSVSEASTVFATLSVEYCYC